MLINFFNDNSRFILAQAHGDACERRHARRRKAGLHAISVDLRRCTHKDLAERRFTHSDVAQEEKLGQRSSATCLHVQKEKLFCLS